jgi:ATP-dependent RNA helicase HelY
VVDLLGQLTEASGAAPRLRDTARRAMVAVNRGVLAYNAVG